MIEKLLMQVLQKIRIRFPNEIIEPLPNKTWDECIDNQCGLLMLHYHIKGDKSSKMEYIEL